MIDDQNEHDINSVAGVLKLYFRGLENPIFPKERFLDFISTISESQTTQNIQSHHRREWTGQIEKDKTHLAVSQKLSFTEVEKGMQCNTWKQSQHQGSLSDI